MGVFVYKHTITLEDTSGEGDVYWNNFGKLFGRAREHFLRSFFPNTSKVFKFLREKKNVTIATQDFYCKFCKPIYHEDVVLVMIHVSELNPASAQMSFRVVDKETRETVGEGSQKVVFVNVETWKPTRMPPEIREAARQYLSD